MAVVVIVVVEEVVVVVDVVVVNLNQSSSRGGRPRGRLHTFGRLRVVSHNHASCSYRQFHQRYTYEFFVRMSFQQLFFTNT